MGLPTLGGWEWLIILVIVIILFGGSRLAGLGQALGQSIREFRQAVNTGKEGDDKDETENTNNEASNTTSKA